MVKFVYVWILGCCVGGVVDCKCCVKSRCVLCVLGVIDVYVEEVFVELLVEVVCFVC